MYSCRVSSRRKSTCDEPGQFSLHLRKDFTRVGRLCGVDVGVGVDPDDTGVWIAAVGMVSLNARKIDMHSGYAMKGAARWRSTTDA